MSYDILTYTIHVFFKYCYASFIIDCLRKFNAMLGIVVYKSNLTIFIQPFYTVDDYQYFANNNITAADKPKFFNEINIPPYWVIEGTNDNAEIKDMGKVRGRILYQPNYQARIVNRVEWLDEDGQIRFVDHYTKHGIKFAQTVYDKRGGILPGILP